MFQGVTEIYILYSIACDHRSPNIRSEEDLRTKIKLVSNSQNQINKTSFLPNPPNLNKSKCLTPNSQFLEASPYLSRMSTQNYQDKSLPQIALQQITLKNQLQKLHRKIQRSLKYLRRPSQPAMSFSTLCKQIQNNEQILFHLRKECQTIVKRVLQHKEPCEDVIEKTKQKITKCKKRIKQLKKKTKEIGSSLQKKNDGFDQQQSLEKQIAGFQARRIKLLERKEQSQDQMQRMSCNLGDITVAADVAIQFHLQNHTSVKLEQEQGKLMQTWKNKKNQYQIIHKCLESNHVVKQQVYHQLLKNLQSFVQGPLLILHRREENVQKQISIRKNIISQLENVLSVIVSNAEENHVQNQTQTYTTTVGKSREQTYSQPNHTSFFLPSQNTQEIKIKFKTIEEAILEQSKEKQQSKNCLLINTEQNIKKSNCQDQFEENVISQNYDYSSIEQKKEIQEDRKENIFTIIQNENLSNVNVQEKQKNLQKTDNSNEQNFDDQIQEEVLNEPNNKFDQKSLNKNEQKVVIKQKKFVVGTSTEHLKKSPAQTKPFSKKILNDQVSNKQLQKNNENNLQSQTKYDKNQQISNSKQKIINQNIQIEEYSKLKSQTQFIKQKQR